VKAKTKTIWHQPNDLPSIGTVDQIKSLLNDNKIAFTTKVSNLKNHTAFDVDKTIAKEAIQLIQLKYGRNV